MRLSTAVAEGIIGGAAGAGCMTVLRVAARRAGLIDFTPPQATEQWLTRRAGVAPDGPGGHHLLAALIHVAVGTTGGAIWGALERRTSEASAAGGALFGVGVWLVAFGALAPALGITRPLERATWRETVVNVAAHLLYGTATALVAGELGRQGEGRAPLARGAGGRVG
jgi:hypothetical protein